MKIGNLTNSNTFFLIAGPCAIESEEHTLKIATELKKITEELEIPFVFKSSFDKANRTSIDSYRGPGLKKGLEILKKVKAELNIPVTTDIHESWQAKEVTEVVDIIQIPAFLSRQTDLLVEAGKTGKIISIKKAQFMAPHSIENSVKKVESTNNKNILLMERGTSFGYNNLVVDFRGMQIMKKLSYPIVYDATHSVQLPSGLGNQSGGDREFIEPLLKAAVASGVDGIFMEIHDNPSNALCDKACQFPLEKIKELLTKLKKIYEASQ